MEWHQYTLVYRLHSSLHIGYRKVGNLMQTRPYVPGKNLWAALTERLTREQYSTPAYQDYVIMGESVRQNFRFGYLYPALKGKTGYEALFPWQDDLFAYRFLDSYASTALQGASRVAEPGSLHEIEFIRPYTRPLPGEPTMPVYLLGHLYVQADLASDSPLAIWQNALTRLQIGGERSYGWGQIQLQELLRSQKTVSCPGSKLNKGDFTPAHVLVSRGDATASSLQGMIEPLVGWERGDPEQGRYWQLTPSPMVAYRPGSLVTEPLTVTLHPFGMLDLH